MVEKIHDEATKLKTQKAVNFYYERTNPQPETRNSKLETLNSKLETLNSKPETQNTKLF